MKQTKRQTIERGNKGWKIVMCLIVIIGIFIFTNYWTNKQPHYFCKKNPDKCISLNECKTSLFNKHCKEQFHIKTQSELDIDD